MKVFISSVTRNFKAFRDAAAAGVVILGHEVVRAEDLGASPDSPQQACLAGVRAADATILILGERYGDVQASGLSATHEEYREARDVRPVLVFVQEGVSPDPQQAAFLREVAGWERGHFTANFRDPDSLRDQVILALHGYELVNTAMPLDETELIGRAQSLVPPSRSTSDAELVVAVASGPVQTILRPAELESDRLRRFLLAEAITGDDAPLTPSLGTDISAIGDAIQLVQDRGSSLVRLDEAANLVVIQPALENTSWLTGIPSLIEEVIKERIARAIRFTARVLTYVDPAQRLSHVVIIVGLTGAGYRPWRTRAEHQQSPNAASLGLGRTERIVVALSPAVRRRAALVHDTQRLAEDFAVRLRRAVRK